MSPLTAARAAPKPDPAAEAPEPFSILRLGFGIVGGVALTVALSTVLPNLPSWLRFAIALLTFTIGCGALTVGWLITDLAVAEQVIVMSALGVAIAPAFGDALGRVGLTRVFPYVAGAGAGVFIARVAESRLKRKSSPVARSHLEVRDRQAVALLPILVALITGAIVFQHRLLADADGTTVFGDYDSVDLSYYAAITSELSHRVPPMAPFYAGHALNYSWYPQLLLAQVHQFAGVPILEMYFRYAWPALLALGAAAAFLFVRSIASTGVALLATLLILVGGDFSYAFVSLPRPASAPFDWLLWPTNFLAPTMEVLHFSTWTPSLPPFFVGLYALARAERGARRAAWLTVAAVAFALLVQFKPFAFAVIVAALGAATVFATRDRQSRRRLAVTLGLTLALATPFLLQIVRLYSESRSHLKLDYFLLPRTMLDKLGLADTVHAAVAHVAPDGLSHTAIVLTIATILFFVGGLGVRWAGVRSMYRALWPASAERPIWQLLAWIVVAGIAIPFVIVTDPYHDTLQFYQTALFVLWIFTARAILTWPISSRARAVAAGLALAAAIPSSIHYLIEKHGDGPNHPLARLSRSEMTVADYLRTTNPDTTVILHDRPLDPSLFVIRSERRAVLAWRAYVTGSEDRRREVDRFFGSADREPAVAFDVLSKHKVTHVIDRPARDRVNREVLARLKPVLVFPDIALYEVPPGVQ